MQINFKSFIKKFSYTKKFTGEEELKRIEFELEEEEKVKVRRRLNYLK